MPLAYAKRPIKIKVMSSTHSKHLRLKKPRVYSINRTQWRRLLAFLKKNFLKAITLCHYNPATGRF